MKFSIKDFFSKCDQIRSFLRIWSHLLKKSLIENFIFCAVSINGIDQILIEITDLTLTNILLFAEASFDRAFNTQILDATIQYILSTKRF